MGGWPWVDGGREGGRDEWMDGWKEGWNEGRMERRKDGKMEEIRTCMLVRYPP